LRKPHFAVRAELDHFGGMSAVRRGSTIRRA
jgi:hypothetical protein